MKNVCFQLIKEFSIPFTLSVCWTVYVVYDTPLNLKDVISAFGPAFFLSSWMTGQFFRVKKQENMKQGIESVEDRMENLLKALEVRTQEIVNYTTGGNSLCYFAVNFRGFISTWTLLHSGEYPIYDLSIESIDVDEFIKCNELHQVCPRKNFYVGNLSPGHFKEMWEIQLFDKEPKNINIFFYARNFYLAQEIRFRHVNGFWECATQLLGVNNKTNAQEALYQNIGRFYPRDEDGWPEGLSKPIKPEVVN